MDSMPSRFYIQTVGCQMNVLDSELVAADLLRAGYELVDSPGQADTILLNTCSVRQHAEDKIYSALGRLKHSKQQRPERSSACSAAWPKRTSRRSSAAPRTSIWWSDPASWANCRRCSNRSPPAAGRGSK